MAKARPWWERKQAVDVRDAARAVGFSAFIRLGGLIEIVEGPGTSVMDARFSFNTGAINRAIGTSAKGNFARFTRDGVYTSREIADAIVAWFQSGRTADPAALLRSAMVRRMGVDPGLAEQPDHDRELAPVTPITGRRNV